MPRDQNVGLLLFFNNDFFRMNQWWAITDGIQTMFVFQVFKESKIQKFQY